MTGWTLGRWLAGVALVGLALTAAAAEQKLPVRNPGFEADDNGDGLPDGWSFAWRSTHSGDAQRGIEKREPDWGWDKQVKHSGQASIRCGVSRPVDDGVWTQDGIPLPNDAKFLRVTAWCRARNVNAGQGNVALVFLGQNNKWLGASYHAISVTQDCDWTRYVGYAKVPKGSSRLRLRCWVNFNYSGTGTFWFDDIEVWVVDRMVAPKTVYIDDTPPPQPTADEERRGFILFSRSYLRLVFSNTVPRASERVSALSASACPGEYEPVVLVVHPLRELAGVSVEVSDLSSPRGSIPASAVDVRSIRYHLKKGQARWGPFNETLMEVPLFLEKRPSVDLPARRNQPFWLTIHVPEDAPAGDYTGSVTVRVADKAAAVVPLRLTVYPFRLAEPKGVTFAMYTRMRQDPAWIRETFADMRAHGMTSVALCGNSGLSMRAEGDHVVVDWNGQSALERNMSEYVRVGFPEPMVWLMGGDIPGFCQKLAPLDSDRFAVLYRSAISQIVAHAKAVGWPEIIFQPIDEPFEHTQRLERALRLLQILKTIPGLRTEEDGMNGRWQAFTDEFYRLTDVLVLHDGPTLRRGTLDLDEWRRFLNRATRDGKTIWFYNIDLTGWHPEPMRFMAGFGLWKTGAKGVIEWAYMFPVREDNPGAVYKQPAALLYRFPPAPGESGGPTIAYEAMREGIDDYRYLLTLYQLVEKARQSGKPNVLRRANDLWAAVQSRLDAASLEGCKGRAAQGNWTGKCEYLPDGNRAVRGDHKIPNNWHFSDYDDLRGQIAAAITKLIELTR